MKTLEERIQAYEKNVNDYCKLLSKINEMDEKQRRLIQLLVDRRKKDRERNKVKLERVKVGIMKKCHELEAESGRQLIKLC